MPPDTVWARLQGALAADAAPTMHRRHRRRARWFVAAALSAAAVLLLLVPPSGDEDRIELDPYFTRLEANPHEPDVLASIAGEFEAASAVAAMRVAGLDDAGPHSPSPAFSLWQARIQRFAHGEVAQLVYRGEGGTFSVFVAPHSAELDFGGRRTERVRMGDWECTRVEARELAVFWSVSQLRQSVLVAPADQEIDVAAILRFFVYGEWGEGS